MQITDEKLFAEAKELLIEFYGKDAAFKEGQYEAVEAAMTKGRTLVVQRTGWGKSLVYFMCTRMLRRRERGFTMVISPLLVLMENQMEAARKHGLTCAQLNGSVTGEERREILEGMKKNAYDIVFTTPETLFKQVTPVLKDISIGMFVIDEAHCISDWGHDFRLGYNRLREVIRLLPSSVPLLATTATANNRVVEDLQDQLGENIFTSRGPLERDSLRLQVLPLESRAERYAWILENLEHLPGSGVIYCLTKRDCDMLARFLQAHGVNAVSYHAGTNEEANREMVEKFYQDKIKVIVATSKLGMGYDKGNIAFVIHFQMPANIVAYYQQIGRAGRNIPCAYVFLMSGREDEDILEYFIRTAFPTEYEMGTVMEYIKQQDGGAGLLELEAHLNIRRTRIEKALAFLYNGGHIRKDGSSFCATPNTYVYQGEHYQQIMAIRRQEKEQMKELTRTKDCLSKYIIRCLDDPGAHSCGHCANCTGQAFLPSAPSPEMWEKAKEYLSNTVFKIEPRKRWPYKIEEPKGNIRPVNQEGICLAKYGDFGWGALVKSGRYSQEKRFSDVLVQKSAEILQPFILKHGITQITCVPSLRTDLVENFSRRLAERVGIPFAPLLNKSAARPQKEMENSAHQCLNAWQSFSAAEGVPMPKKVLLVDDMVDSGWTLTVCGFRLMEKGCQEVYPFALADSGQSEDD